MIRLNLFSLICILMIGCESAQSNGPDWKSVDCAQLRKEVDEKTGPYRMWNYSGSDESYHYFYSETRKFVGRPRKFFKLSKAQECDVVGLNEEPYSGRFEHVDYVFSVPQKNGEGYVHSFAFGVTTSQIQTFNFQELFDSAEVE